MRTGVSGNWKRVSLPVLAVALVALTVAAPARSEAASADCFLKIEGVAGDSANSRHKDEIDVLTWGFGESQSVSAVRTGATTATAGRVQMQDLRFTARMGKQSPRLFQECAMGRHLRQATLTCQKMAPGPFDFLRIRIEDVIVTGYQTGTPASTGSPAQPGLDTYPVDQVSLGFAKIRVEFQAQKPDGTGAGWIPGGWDLMMNKAF